MRRKMDEAELSKHVVSKLRTAEIFTTEIQQERETAWDYYNQEKFGDEQEGQSQVVTSDVRDVIEWLQPNLLDMIFASDCPVEFAPHTAEDVDQALVETKYVRNVLFNQRDSYLKMLTWIKDGLMQKVGVVKAFWDETQEDKREEWHNLTELEYTNVLNDDTVTIIEHTVKVGDEELSEEEAAGLAVQGVETKHDVVIRRKRDVGRIRIENVVPEYFFVERDHDSIDLEGCDFVCEIIRTTRGALIEEGYSQDVVMQIPKDNRAAANQEQANRFEKEGGVVSASDDSPDSMMDEIFIYEAYLRVDFDGDGNPEMRYVKLAGDTASLVLENEEVDRHPYHAWTPNVLPHKFYGRSTADDVMDLQKVNSVLWRQALDNIYLTNAPAKKVRMGAVNIEDLLNRKPGSLIRVNSMDDVQDDVVPFMANHAMGMMEQTNRMRAERTGVSPEQQGLNPEALANSTNMVGAMILNNAQLRVKMIARNIAELGLKSLVLHVHELSRKHEDRERVIRIGGGWAPVNPKTWRERTDVNIRVGIGYADRKELVTVLERTMALQEKVVEKQGPDGPLLGVDNLYKTLTKYLDTMGVRDVDTYFRNPATYQPPQTEEPMETALQIEEAKVTVEAQNKAAEVRMRSEELALKREMFEHQKIEDDRNYDLKLRELQKEYGREQ